MDRDTTEFCKKKIRKPAKKTKKLDPHVIIMFEILGKYDLELSIKIHNGATDSR